MKLLPLLPNSLKSAIGAKTSKRVAKAASAPTIMEASQTMEGKALVVQKLASWLNIYLGATNLGGAEIDQLGRFLARNYPKFSPEDIEAALEALAAKKLPLDVKAYYGITSAVQLGQIIDAYKVVRFKVLGALERAEAKAAQEEKDIQSRKDYVSAVEEKKVRELKELHREAKAGMPAFTSWDELPEYAYRLEYDFAVKNGLINPTADQKWAAWHAARPFAERKTATIMAVERKEAPMLLLKQIQAGAYQGDVKVYQEHIAKKILLIDLLLGDLDYPKYTGDLSSLEERAQERREREIKIGKMKAAKAAEELAKEEKAAQEKQAKINRMMKKYQSKASKK